MRKRRRPTALGMTLRVPMTLLYCFGSNALDPYKFMNALDMMLRIPMSYKCFVRGAQEPYESINSKSQHYQNMADFADYCYEKSAMTCLKSPKKLSVHYLCSVSLSMPL